MRNAQKKKTAQGAHSRGTQVFGRKRAKGEEAYRQNEKMRPRLTSLGKTPVAEGGRERGAQVAPRQSNTRVVCINSQEARKHIPRNKKGGGGTSDRGFCVSRKKTSEGRQGTGL